MIKAYSNLEWIFRITNLLPHITQNKCYELSDAHISVHIG